MRPLPLASLALTLLLAWVQPAPALAQGGPAYPVLDRKPPPAQTEPRLTARERAAFPALAAQEDALRALAGRFQEQSTRLAALRAESDRLLAERAAVEMETLALAAKLKAMLPELWALNLGVVSSMDHTATPWDESDRRLHWLGAAYARGREELGALREKSAVLAANVARQERLRAETSTQRDKVEKLKDALAGATLRLLHDVSALRQEQRPPGRELDRIMETLARFDFSPPLCEKRPLNQSKGALPWPADGRQGQAFAPEANPPRQGVELATVHDAPVKAVFWGKVVFADTVRPLGKVVIVSHGQQAFTVYAHLSRIAVRPGQDVNQGDVLGQAGWLPSVFGPGFSFELRFREKPINPGGWLTASG
ncbi:peptidoglycan DD-metalloendopeptidase family protein [Fundidesulfovibrio butyratiphilus]